MRLMQLLVRLRLSLWLLALGAIVLYVFFVTLATIPPARVAALTAVTVVLAGLVIARNLRISSGAL